MMELLTPQEAFEIASQWGSYMRNGDPGSVFYTFPTNKALVQNEEHRTDLLAYTHTLLQQVRYSSQREELERLQRYFLESPAQDAVRYWTDGSGVIWLGMSLEQADSMSHPGPCDEDVAMGMRHPEITAQLDVIDPNDLRVALKEYGCWDDDDLKDHQDNLERLVWLAAGDIADGSCE
jgi:hypothetical protein